MSDDEYAYGDLDELTALLEEDEDNDPYQDDGPSSIPKKYSPAVESASQSGQRSMQKSLQRSTHAASNVSSQGQGSSRCEKEETDETKSKEELMGKNVFAIKGKIVLKGQKYYHGPA